MRILFTAWAWPSHLYAMAPLVWACRAAGHTVAVASQPALAPLTQRCGLPAVGVGRDLDAVPVLRRFVLPPDRPVVPPPGADPRPPAGRGPSGPPRVIHFLADIAEATAGDLFDFCRRWRPDLLIHDPTDFSGPVVATALGIPTARYLYGLDVMHHIRRFLPDALAPLTRRFGLPDVDVASASTLDPCPSGLQLPVERPTLPLRHVPYHGLPGPAPAPFGVSQRPRICVTWGTTMARLGGASLCAAGPVALALASLDAEVVVAVLADQRPLLGDLPPHVRVVESAPLTAVLPSCAVVVHHGGAGTMLAALRCGVPQLVVPQLPDHALHGRQLVAAGAGLALNRADAVGEQLRTYVTRLLTDDAYSRAAGELARQMRQRPAPAQVVPALESLTSRIAGRSAN